MNYNLDSLSLLVGSGKKFINLLKRYMNHYLDLADLDSFRKAVQIGELNLDEPDVKSLDFAILYLRYYILSDLFAYALAYFKQLQALHQSKMRKRYINLLIEAAPDQATKLDLYQQYSQPFYQSDQFDLLQMPDDPLVIHNLKNTHTVLDTIPKGWTKCDDSNIRLLTLSADQKTLLKIKFKAVVKRKLPTFDSKISYVIDGANVLFYGAREVTFDGYVRLTNLLTKLVRKVPGEEIVLVLHHRHFGFSTKFRSERDQLKLLIPFWSNMVRVVKTPSRVDDDIYSISIAVDNDCTIVTNDRFRDHANEIDTNLRIWRDENGLTYTAKKRTVMLNSKIKYSTRVQCNDNIWYVPMADGTWISKSSTASERPKGSHHMVQT